MEPNAIKTVRVLKRLKAAVGYHELGMTQHALRCLDGLAPLGQIGPFGLVADVLRDEFSNVRHMSAEKALDMVACMLPTHARRAVQLTLAVCYGSEDNRRSANDRAVFRGAAPAAEPKPAA
jgi:hypothetical protein